MAANSRVGRNKNETEYILPPLSLLERLSFAPNSFIPKWHKGILCLCCSFLLILFFCSSVGPQPWETVLSTGYSHSGLSQPRSPTGCSACKKPAPAWAPFHRPWLLPGACSAMGCRVKICSAMVLHGLQGSNLCHHGLGHGLQGNLCSSLLLSKLVLNTLFIPVTSFVSLVWMQPRSLFFDS